MHTLSVDDERLPLDGIEVKSKREPSAAQAIVLHRLALACPQMPHLAHRDAAFGRTALLGCNEILKVRHARAPEDEVPHFELGVHVASLE